MKDEFNAFTQKLWLMKYCFILLFILMSEYIFSQRISQVPDSLRAKRTAAKKKEIAAGKVIAVTDESQIKERLVALSLKNPIFVNADAEIKLAELNLYKTRSSLLSSISAGANFNEFAVSKSPVASFYPKYNIGLSVPFDLFAKNKIERKIADQNIIITNALKEQRIIATRAEVLIRYENYKEKKELVRLQKISIEDDYSAYLAAQKNYSDGILKLDEMNRVYQTYTNEQAKLISRQKDFNVSIIQLEEMIGVPLEKVILNTNK